MKEYNREIKKLKKKSQAKKNKLQKGSNSKVKVHESLMADLKHVFGVLIQN